MDPRIPSIFVASNPVPGGPSEVIVTWVESQLRFPDGRSWRRRRWTAAKETWDFSVFFQRVSWENLGCWWFLVGDFCVIFLGGFDGFMEYFFGIAKWCW